jgi:hypothetical protein
LEAPQVSELSPEVRRNGAFLDDNLELIQKDDLCWAADTKMFRVWAFISRRYPDVKAPEGWFFLRETIENRVLNKELLAEGAIELGEKVQIGATAAQLARLVPNG